MINFKALLGFLFCLFTVSSYANSAVDQNKNDALGPQRTAVILYDLSGGEAKDRPTANDIYAAVFKSEYSTAAFIKEASYGRATLEGKVFGWFKNKKWNSKCELSADEVLQDLSKRFDLKDYDRYLVGLQLNEGNCSKKGVGIGASSFGRLIFASPQGNLRISYAYFLTNHYLSRPELPRRELARLAAPVVTHELMHSMGSQGHANLLDCGIDSVSKGGQGCKQEGIADLFSILGGEGFHRPATHPSACHKELFGWFGTSDLITLNISDLSKPLDITLSPYSDGRSDNGPKSIRINLNLPIEIQNKNNSSTNLTALFFEYRKDMGFDGDIAYLKADPIKYWPNLAWTQNKKIQGPVSLPSSGLQIRGGFFIDNKCVTSYLIDGNPNSLQYGEQTYSLYDSLDSFYQVGSEFTEPTNNIHVKVISEDSNGLKLRISK